MHMKMDFAKTHNKKKHPVKSERAGEAKAYRPASQTKNVLRLRK